MTPSDKIRAIIKATPAGHTVLSAADTAEISSLLREMESAVLPEDLTISDQDGDKLSLDTLHGSHVASVQVASASNDDAWTMYLTAADAEKVVRWLNHYCLSDA